MKKFQTWLVGIALSGVLISTVSFASFTGGSTGLSLPDIITGLTGIFAKLDLTNTFTEKQEIEFADPTVNIYNGLKITNDQYPAICLGPTTGWNRQACISGGNTLKLHGLGGNLYDTTTTGNKALEYDMQNRRLWLSNNGVTNIGGNSTSASATTVTVGGHLRDTATFLVDATNDWTKQLPIAAPAATECDDAAEKGRLYFDSTENTYKSCDGENWSSSARNHIYRIQATSTTTFYTDSKVSLIYDAAGDLDINVSSLPAGGFYSHSCFNHSSQDEATVNTTGAEELWGSLSHGVHIICNVAANDDPTWSVYYIEVYMTGSGASDDVIVNLRVL